MDISEVEKLLINPFYCINISPSLVGNHKPIITKEGWIQAQKKLINEIGEDKYFITLLSVLEGDFI